jgi:hypothetical protein
MPARDPIASYARALTPAAVAICRKLRSAIDGALPEATSRIWHGAPVWFVGENPVVGYSSKAKAGDTVTLLFWNGQSFGEPDLEAVGSFHAAQIQYRDVRAIDAKPLVRWLGKAGKDIWDAVAWRRAMLARRRA